MRRVAFKMHIKKGSEQEYIERHKAVWPGLLALHKEGGISNYSIFLRGQELFLYLECEDVERAFQIFDESPLGRKWEDFMAPLFDPEPDLQPGEPYAMMKEVFHQD